ncbi:hypothetical protein CCH79_00002506, partial [Gambusia affinis]
TSPQHHCVASRGSGEPEGSYSSVTVDRNCEDLCRFSDVGGIFTCKTRSSNTKADCDQSPSLSTRQGSESRFHLSVILFFGVFSICLLIGLLVANAQYNDAKRQLTEDLQVSKKTLASKRSEINQLKETLDKKSSELKRALSAQNSDPKCNANEELQRDLTERLLACNESFFTITKERDWLNNRLVESRRKGIDGGSSEQNNSMFNMTEGNELSALLTNLTASRQESEKKLSFLFLAKLGETTKELL